PGRDVASGQNLRRYRRNLHTDMTVATCVLRPHMTNHLDLCGNVIQLLGGLFPNLCERGTAATDTLERRQLVAYFDAWQVRCQGGTAGRLRGGFIFTQRGGLKWRVEADGLEHFNGGFGFIEQAALAGRLAELLAACAVLLDAHQAQRFF